MCLTIPHLLANIARAVNCGSQKQGHINATFNWCGQLALVEFCMNSMGAHFKQVSISLVNAESNEGIKNSYQAMYAGLYTLYNVASLCDRSNCGFCTQIRAQVVEDGGLW